MMGDGMILLSFGPRKVCFFPVGPWLAAKAVVDFPPLPLLFFSCHEKVFFRQVLQRDRPATRGGSLPF